MNARCFVRISDNTSLDSKSIGPAQLPSSKPPQLRLQLWLLLCPPSLLFFLLRTFTSRTTRRGNVIPLFFVSSFGSDPPSAMGQNNECELSAKRFFTLGAWAASLILVKRYFFHTPCSTVWNPHAICRLVLQATTIS
uniref:Uncharacterized protein n=1 Tax=Neobodo designis TaxID=312471 RepID=A0A7S1PQW9_NEODS